MNQSTQLLGISNAIVDVLAHIDADFLASIDAVPGSMTLIDRQRANEIYSMMGPATEMSGGSVANTIAGFANLGGSTAYIGRVSADQLGEIFNHDMVLITADGQRTMQTYLGACTELSVNNITPESVGSPKAILLEGYVWDLPEGPALARKAIDIAAQNGTAVALSLSDSFCVDRHRESFDEAIRDGVKIVVANEDEIGALMQTANFEKALTAIQGYDNLFVITRSETGSVIVCGDEKVEQAAIPVKNLVDTTGAGDAYTAGFLYGWVNDRSLAECAKLGTFCGTTVIQQVGARIEPGLLDDYS